MAVLKKPIVVAPSAADAASVDEGGLASYLTMRNVISVLVLILTGHLVWYHTSDDAHGSQVSSAVAKHVGSTLSSIFSAGPARDAVRRRSATPSLPLEAPADPDALPEAESSVANNVLGDDSGKFITVINEDNCTFVVNNAIKYTPPQSKWRLRHCGAAVTRRSKDIPRNELDPMLECDYFLSAQFALALAKYVWQQPIVQEGGHDMIHHIWSDFGCFTAYTIDEPVLFGTGAGHIETASVVVPSKRKLLDVGSTVAVQRWRQHEMDFSNHHQEYFQVRNHLNGKVDVVLQAVKGGNWSVITDELAKHGIDVIQGNVITVSSRYTHIKLIGQVFQEFMTYISRIFTTGLLELPNLTIVLQALSEGHDEALRSWLYPYLPMARILTIPNGRTILSQKPWFISVSGTESIEPCHGLFISYFLLPRVLRKLRGDPSFAFGDESKRNNTAVSDMEWLRTMPKKIFLIKNNANARHNRGWNFDAAARAKLESWGFTIVPDTTPFEHRLVLINGADQLVTSWGALVAMMSRLYGGPHLRPNWPLRMIVMVHTGYSNERGWNAVRRARLGSQSDVEVLVSDTSALTPQHTWVKYIFAKDGGDLVHSISEELMRFEVVDCTFNASQATDFKGRYVVSTPYTNDRPFRDMQDGWKKLPKYGYSCPLPPD